MSPKKPSKASKAPENLFHHFQSLLQLRGGAGDVHSHEILSALPEFSAPAEPETGTQKSFPDVSGVIACIAHIQPFQISALKIRNLNLRQSFSEPAPEQSIITPKLFQQRLQPGFSLPPGCFCGSIGEG
jgi:hypothetical protein